MQRIEHNLSTGETAIVELTAEEEQAILDAQPTQAQILQAQIANIDQQLAELDGTIFRNRGTREQDLISAKLVAYFYNNLTAEEKTYLETVVDPTLYATSREYKKVKDLEVLVCEPLRAQRKILDDQLDLLQS